MGKTFQGIHVCAIGKLKNGDKIPQWVRANGGEFHREINPRVTHLISSMEAFKQNVETGMAFTRFGSTGLPQTLLTLLTYYSTFG